MRTGLAAIVFHYIGAAAQRSTHDGIDSRISHGSAIKPTESPATLVQNGKVNLAENVPKNKSYTPSFSPFTQTMVDIYIDTSAVCAEHDGPDERGWDWHHEFVKAECDTEWGFPHVYKVTCESEYKLPRRNAKTYRYGEKVFPRPCPPGTFCRAAEYMGEGDTGLRTNIICSDNNQITVEEVSSSAGTAESTTNKVHCGRDLWLPASRYRAAPSGQQFDLIMTEQVLFPNGSAYPASVLFIRDKTSRYGYDRVLRQHASVAASSVTFQSVRGKIQPRLYQFCMQMMPGKPHAWVTFMYSWTLVAHRRGRIYKELDREKITEQQGIQAVAN